MNYVSRWDLGAYCTHARYTVLIDPSVLCNIRSYVFQLINSSKTDLEGQQSNIVDDPEKIILPT